LIGLRETPAAGVMLLSQAASPAILTEILAILERVPPRRLVTPRGKTMSVAMTNCGTLGWVSDRTGYRYSPVDPATGAPWPGLPDSMRTLAIAAAAEAGFDGFRPDACLINLYEATSRMGLHQDRDESDFTQPIVSLSFGRSARFRFGGTERRQADRSLILADGDVLVFGGPARLMYHGVDKLIGPPHSVLGERRVNVTFRAAGIAV